MRDGSIVVFAEKSKKLAGIELPVQSTSYPAFLEPHGVKAHRNVSGLPKQLTIKNR